MSRNEETLRRYKEVTDKAYDDVRAQFDKPPARPTPTVTLRKNSTTRKIGVSSPKDPSQKQIGTQVAPFSSTLRGPPSPPPPMADIPDPKLAKATILPHTNANAPLSNIPHRHLPTNASAVDSIDPSPPKRTREPMINQSKRPEQTIAVNQEKLYISQTSVQTSPSSIQSLQLHHIPVSATPLQNHIRQQFQAQMHPTTATSDQLVDKSPSSKTPPTPSSQLEP